MRRFIIPFLFGVYLLTGCDSKPTGEQTLNHVENAQTMPVVVPDTSSSDMPVVPMDTSKSNMPVVTPEEGVLPK